MNKNDFLFIPHPSAFIPSNSLWRNRNDSADGRALRLLEVADNI